MFTENIINKASFVLREIFNEYRDKGFISVYLWGSLARNDFDPIRSDVDALVIVNSDFPTDKLIVIRKFLKESAPEIRDFNINYIYIDELNGGEPQSPLAKILHPRQLLLNFYNWKYVVGKRFERTDFLLNDFTYPEAVQYIKQDLYKRFIPNINNSNFDVKHFTKLLLTMCHYINCQENGKYQFSHNTLLENSTAQTKELISILFKVRRSGYALDTLKPYVPKIIKFLADLKQKSASEEDAVMAG
ncbi:MAG: nucleotidyltransferase domain-containing protein [Candidatus Yanofskybacteria bacterium]|nr:nucleotidyltransferase domain-containing protein [Candidatus Yanofskybacteria bacterium]